MSLLNGAWQGECCIGIFDNLKAMDIYGKTLHENICFCVRGTIGNFGTYPAEKTYTKIVMDFVEGREWKTKYLLI